MARTQTPQRGLAGVLSPGVQRPQGLLPSLLQDASMSVAVPLCSLRRSRALGNTNHVTNRARCELRRQGPLFKNH